jgi:hypothetical protein
MNAGTRTRSHSSWSSLFAVISQVWIRKHCIQSTAPFSNRQGISRIFQQYPTKLALARTEFFWCVIDNRSDYDPTATPRRNCLPSRLTLTCGVDLASLAEWSLIGWSHILINRSVPPVFTTFWEPFLRLFPLSLGHHEKGVYHKMYLYR